MQRRSASRRRSTVSKPPVYKNKRVIAVGAAVLALAGFLTVTQVSDASTRRRNQQRANCSAPATATQNAPATAAAGGQSADPDVSSSADPKAGDVPVTGQTAGTLNGGTQNGRKVNNYVGDGQTANGGRWHKPGQCPTPTAGSGNGSGNSGGNGGGSTSTASAGSSTGTGSSTGATSAPTTAAPLEILGDDCSNSKLAAHTGFQDGNRCVSTAFGEVGNADKNPTLLITRAPTRVRVGQAFTLQVSTRNLVRDRFLGAAAGGYYKESSFLNDEGLVRGHFHTACRMLPSTREAPQPDPVPAFFVATQDNGGGATPDTITINVSGMPSRGTAQCASWAGDGSHRVPMMARANEIPAIDSVRITVQ
jgi:hypothetical protein